MFLLSSRVRRFSCNHPGAWNVSIVRNGTMKSLRFRLLLSRNKNVVYSLAFALLGNKEDSEDVTQETFVKLWENMDSVNLRTARAWLLKVARNRAIDLLRKRRFVSGAASNALAEGVGPASADGTPAQRNQAPRETLRLLLLEKAMRKLPENQRVAIFLREVQGLKYDEVAECMGLPPGTVKVAVHRAKKALREEMLKAARSDRGRLVDGLLTG